MYCDVCGELIENTDALQHREFMVKIDSQRSVGIKFAITFDPKIETPDVCRKCIKFLVESLHKEVNANKAEVVDKG
jgi:RNase P subunit RPR2